MSFNLSHIDDFVKAGEPFAAISLPVMDDHPRSFHFFSVLENAQFTDENGAQLRIQPFQEYSEALPQQETTKAEHALMVSDAVSEIHQHKLDKVIVSRLIRSPRHQDQSLSHILQKLGTMYPHAMVFIIQHDQYGAWMGATPELLFTKKENKYNTVLIWLIILQSYVCIVTFLPYFWVHPLRGTRQKYSHSVSCFWVPIGS